MGIPLIVCDDDINKPIEGPTAILLTKDSGKAYLIGTSIRKLEFVNVVMISSFIAIAFVEEAPNSADADILSRFPKKRPILVSELKSDL